MSSTAPSSSVSRSFRALLRTVRETFAGDAVALSKSRAAVREQFRANARERDAAKIARLVADAHDAASFLRESIVQAKLSKDGARYEMKIAPQKSGSHTIVTTANDAAAGAGKDAEKKGDGCCGGGCH